MKRNILFWIFFVLIGVVLPTTAASLYPYDDPKQTAQFQHLIADLRCPVCQNQNIADSNAPLAKTLRQEVYRAVQRGQTDEHIMRDMVARYGDFIVFNPPVKALTWVLWFGPFVFLLIGMVIFYFLCVKRKPHD